MQKDSTIRLLIVDDRVEDAEAVVTALRNGGIAVRPLRPQGPAELAQMVAGQPVDLVLASNSTSMPLEQVCAQVAASGKDLPLLALVDRIDDAAVLSSLGNGVRAKAVRVPQELMSSVVAERTADGKLVVHHDDHGVQAAPKAPEVTR